MLFRSDVDGQARAGFVEHRAGQRRAARIGDAGALVDADVEEIAHETVAVVGTKQRERLAALGIPLTPSVGNFILARFPDGPGKNADAAFAFLQSRGILVRQMGGYGLPQYLRITIGTGEEMERVAATITEFMSAR